MPWRCCVPGCKGYDEARSLGVVFHGLPTRDPPRCRTWLRAIRNPRLHEDMPTSKYSGVRVCSLHFQPEDYEEDFRAKILNTTPKPTLKSGAVPSVFPGRKHPEPGSADTAPPAPKKSRAPAVSAAAGVSSQADDSFCIVVSVDSLDDSFEPASAVTWDSDDDDKDCAIVHHPNLMELFKMCQTCGQPIADKQVFHSGAQTRVTWSCRGGHAGTWRSSPHLRQVLQ